MAQFLEVSTVAVLNIHNNTSNKTISVKSVSVPTAPSENISGGTINSTEYLDIAHRVNSFIATNGVAPNFASTSLGNMRYQSLVYAYSRILYSYDVNKELPDYITVDSWSVVSSSSTTFYNEDQINDAASRVKSFIETNRQLPNFVTISGRQVNMPSFLKLVTTSLLNVAGNFYTSTACKNYGSAPNPSENIINKNMGYSEYITVASNIQTFMYTMGHAPNYASTSFGNVRFQSLIYTYSKLLHHYNSTYNLPSNVTVDPWSVISNPNTAYFTIDQVINASGTVKSSIETNHSLPSTITIAGKQINMRQYLQLATEALLTLRGDLCTSFIPRNYGTATNPYENMTDKYIIYGEYFDIARRVNSFMDSDRIAPNYAIQHSTGETIRYESLVYIYSQILNSYKETDYVPLYINFYPWGKVSNTSTVFFNKNQIIDAAEIVTSYVEANQILPGSVTINGHNVHMTQYLHLQTTMLLNIARDLNSSIIWDKSIDKFYMSQENIVSGTMNTDEYLILAKEVKEYIDSNGFVPDYNSFTSLGIQIGCPSLMYMFSQVMNFYKNNNETLPDYITVTPWVALSNPNSIYNYESNKIFSSIQDAIDDEDTMHGSTIGIGVSSISENIVINKKLTITNVPGVNVTVQAADPNLPVFTITTEGSGSIIHNISINGSTNNIGIFINNSYYNLILENNIESNLNGIFLNNSSYNEIVENNISNNTMNGILIENDSEDNTIVGNKIGYNTINGIKINNSNNNIISNNIVLNNYVDGIYLNNASNLINFNRIVGNNRYGLYNEGNGTVDAQNNWWGSNNPIISLNSTSDIGINGGIVNCDQWLVLNINSSTDRSNRTSTTYNQIITADLTHNNQGKDTSDDRGAFPDNTVPDGIPINFSTTLGTIDSSVNIKRGKSVAILNSSIAGLANVLVTLDNQTVSLPINITSTNTLGIYNNRTGQGFNTIQDAINNVNTLNGDIITLAEGTYTENIVVYKRITIQPVIGANVTVQAADPFKGVISILANGSIIRNLNIIGAADSYAVSSHGNNIKLIENIISKNKHGIYLLNANNNILSGNILTNNVHGISLFNSISNTVSGNNITNNWYGIQFSYSNNNTVSGNNIINNWYGSEFSYSNNNTVSGNNIKDNNMGLFLNYSNNTVSGNNITENAVGISYHESNNALTSGNNIEYNWLKDISHLDTTGVILQNNIFSCGPASLATVMNNMGINITEIEIINLAGIDLSGTSMYGLVHAAQFKGLNATGMILSSDELSIDNIVLLSIAGLNHYSVIKSINDTTVLLADSAFGNIEMTREEFNELFSGYVLIVTNNSTNNTFNGTILTNEQMQNIKGTNAAIYEKGIAIASLLKTAVSIVSVVTLGKVLLPIVAIGVLFAEPKHAPQQYMVNNQIGNSAIGKPTNKYTKPQTTVNRYIPGKGWVSTTGYISSSNIRPVDLEYQRNYEKYTNRKVSELNKIIDTIEQTGQRSEFREKAKNDELVRRFNQYPMITDSPRPDDADPSSITEIILDGYKRMNRGVTKCKEGNMIGGMAEISIGLMEYHVAMAMWIQHL